MTRAAIAMLVLVLAVPARADEDEGESCVFVLLPPEEWSRLGTRVAYGLVTIDDAPLTTMSIGISIDRPVVGKWRALAEYEHLWIGPYDWDSDVGVAALPDGGHRAHLGVRRELVEKRWSYGRVRAFVDGEAGGGAMLVDRMTGDALAVAHAFAGVRAGLSLAWDDRRLDYEVVVRGLATTEGAGVLFGIGLVWGE